jgi:predicted peptidase
MHRNAQNLIMIVTEGGIAVKYKTEIQAVTLSKNQFSMS